MWHLTVTCMTVIWTWSMQDILPNVTWQYVDRSTLEHVAGTCSNCDTNTFDICQSKMYKETTLMPNKQKNRIKVGRETQTRYMVNKRHTAHDRPIYHLTHDNELFVNYPSKAPYCSTHCIISVHSLCLLSHNHKYIMRGC